MKKADYYTELARGRSVLMVGWDFKGGDPQYVAYVFVVDIFARSLMSSRVLHGDVCHPILLQDPFL